MKIALLPLLLFISLPCFSQQLSYKDSILFFREDYVSRHEVVTDSAARSHFSFFPPDSRYRVSARFTPVLDTVGFDMPTYSQKKKAFLIYGYADFRLRGRKCRLYVYRYRKLMNNPKYKDDLFLPFTDKTNGRESYVCRYLDLKIGEIENGRILLDFNKCYNPYCAYSDGFNCPIPPRENKLSFSVKAGEKAYPHNYRIAGGPAR